MEDWCGDDAHRQFAYRLRFDWGLRGAQAIAPDADIAIVVDVLSFTTTLSVALDEGIVVLPYQWKDESAARYAREHKATLAVSRKTAARGTITLSPQSIRDAVPVPRLVLPSPNGSAISFRLAEGRSTVLGASLRNADAIATWIAINYDAAATNISVIAAGEQWADGSLRPAVEDLWGAGAVLSALVARGWTDLSPEAQVAQHAFLGVKESIERQLQRCASGRELIDRGFASDVEIAAEFNSSASVPLLRDRRFVPAP
ncbi:MAG TPA: 2-phosphosulfolactate phosphatase [Thermomicrobiales bacterium]|nr:2-phosphosulfolactate phosphatase [Thermomicrobiales bacterium]